MHRRSAFIVVFVAALGISPALASGFGFYENGAKASGQAGAWVARADDAAANWYNPAALVYGADNEVQFGINYLDIGSDTQFSPTPGVSFDAVSNVTTPAHFYVSQRLGEKKRFAWGFGVNTPFGLVSEWSNAPLTLSSRRAELRTYLVNPNIAFRIGERWSFAVGLDYLIAEVRDFSRDTVVGPFPTTANLTGEGAAWGYNAAIQLKIKSFTMAGQFRSPISPRIEGELTFSGVPGTVLNSAAETKVRLPGQVFIGAGWVSKRWEVELSGYYTQWQYFDQLNIETGNPATTVVLEENWSSSWAYRAGGAFRLGSSLAHELRAGLVHDQTPIPTEFLRPSIPDSDRDGVSIGYGFLAPGWGIDVYAMYIKFEDVTANGSPSAGVIPGTYTSTILLAGVTAKFRF